MTIKARGCREKEKNSNTRWRSPQVQEPFGIQAHGQNFVRGRGGRSIFFFRRIAVPPQWLEALSTLGTIQRGRRARGGREQQQINTSCMR